MKTPIVKSEIRIKRIFNVYFRFTAGQLAVPAVSTLPAWTLIVLCLVFPVLLVALMAIDLGIYLLNSSNHTQLFLPKE